MNKLLWKNDNRIIRSFDQSWYPIEAVEEARTAYQKYCKIEVSFPDDKRIWVSFSQLLSTSHPLSLVVLEFCNYLLDKTCELRLNN